MALRIKAIVLFVVGLVAAVAGLNFILNNVTLLNKLPETRVDQARREALQKPFYEREHRIERQPRLESGVHCLSGQIGANELPPCLSFSEQRLDNACGLA